MQMQGRVLASYLMCHAPIVIPEVAQENSSVIRTSTESMARIASEIADLNPDVVLILSPHSPRMKNNFSLVGGSKIYGNFSQFGHPEIEAKFPNAESLLKHSWPASAEYNLDHGALVPLHFLYQAGWRGPVAVVALPYYSSTSNQLAFSQQLSELIGKSEKKWVLIASGDMSHRLIEGAPAGYHPHAKEFDKTVVQIVQRGDYQQTQEIPNRLRDLAAEDVLDTLYTIAGTTNFRADHRSFYSYEGPFGVGYLMARLFKEDNHASPD